MYTCLIPTKKQSWTQYQEAGTKALKWIRSQDEGGMKIKKYTLCIRTRLVYSKVVDTRSTLVFPYHAIMPSILIYSFVELSIISYERGFNTQNVIRIIPGNVLWDSIYSMFSCTIHLPSLHQHCWTRCKFTVYRKIWKTVERERVLEDMQNVLSILDAWNIHMFAFERYVAFHMYPILKQKRA